MSTLTIRIPETKHSRLRRLAESRGISMNKLIDELATVALTQYDAELRFHALASKGTVKRGIELLDKLDRAARSATRARTAAKKAGRKTPDAHAWAPARSGSPSTR